MRRILTVIGLQAYALLLVFHQAILGVQTDEAKYLLNIPYPHPPFVRWMMSLTEHYPQQEVLWRIIFATLFVQAVWMVWSMGSSFKASSRIALVLAWLSSSAFFLTVGSLYLSPLAALAGLLFLWAARKPASDRRMGLVALVWLASLFTTYQSILYLPLVWRALRKNGCTAMATVLIIAIPVGLLALYTIGSPLVLATMMIHSAEDDSFAWSARFLNLAWLWLLAGSGVVSVLGTVGLAFERRLDRWLSLVLLIAFLATSLPMAYYAILLLPLLVDGLLSLLRKYPALGTWVLGTIVAGSLAMALYFVHTDPPSAARAVMRTIDAASGTGGILIAGSFGHEWQYESSRNVYRFVPSRINQAAAVVCLSACEGLSAKEWRKLQDGPEVWIRR